MVKTHQGVYFSGYIFYPRGAFGSFNGCLRESWKGSKSLIFLKILKTWTQIMRRHVPIIKITEAKRIQVLTNKLSNFLATLTFGFVKENEFKRVSAGVFI